MYAKNFWYVSFSTDPRSIHYLWHEVNHKIAERTTNSTTFHLIIVIERISPNGGGGGGPGVGLNGVPLKDCFRLSERCWQWQKNFDWVLGALSNLMASSLCSRSVARCTKRSAVSHMISLMGSLGSTLNKCCRIKRNGISWGVSATYNSKKYGYSTI